MLRLPIHEAVTFVMVHPHYPENVGAAARAIKTMGFFQLALVKPSKIAVPEHEMALKMAVKSWDVLESARRYQTLPEAIEQSDWVLSTTSRRGFSGVLTARAAAPGVVERAARAEKIAIVLGNEKTGLSAEDHARCHAAVRIPMAADQPSVNLAQAAQILAYELFVAALEARARSRHPDVTA